MNLMEVFEVIEGNFVHITSGFISLDVLKSDFVEVDGNYLYLKNKAQTKPLQS